VEVDLTATHFSFLASSLGAASVLLSASDSEVMLSSVSASTPVVVSDSELDEDGDSVVVASVVDAVVATDTSVLTGVNFLTLERSFLSDRYNQHQLKLVRTTTQHTSFVSFSFCYQAMSVSNHITELNNANRGLFALLFFLLEMTSVI